MAVGGVDNAFHFICLVSLFIRVSCCLSSLGELLSGLVVGGGRMFPSQQVSQTQSGLASEQWLLQEP